MCFFFSQTGKSFELCLLFKTNDLLLCAVDYSHGFFLICSICLPTVSWIEMNFNHLLVTWITFGVMLHDIMRLLWWVIWRFSTSAHICVFMSSASFRNARRKGTNTHRNPSHSYEIHQEKPHASLRCVFMQRWDKPRPQKIGSNLSWAHWSLPRVSLKLAERCCSDSWLDKWMTTNQRGNISWWEIISSVIYAGIHNIPLRLNFGFIIIIIIIISQVPHFSPTVIPL